MPHLLFAMRLPPPTPPPPPRDLKKCLRRPRAFAPRWDLGRLCMHPSLPSPPSTPPPAA